MKRAKLIPSLLLSLPWFLAGAPPAHDQEAERAQILEIHRRDIQAHFDQDVNWLTRNVAPDFFSVENGEVTWPSRADQEQMWQSYLSRTTFTEYRDVIPPIVRVSPDGQLAWSVVQVKVSGTQQSRTGEEQPLNFVSAWATLYEKRNGEWVRVGIISTFKTEN